MTWGRGWHKAAVKSKDDQQAGNLGERQEISPSEPPARIKPKFGRLASGIVREYVSWPPCDHVLQQLQELIHLPMFTLHKHRASRLESTVWICSPLAQALCPPLRLPHHPEKKDQRNISHGQRLDLGFLSYKQDNTWSLLSRCFCIKNTMLSNGCRDFKKEAGLGNLGQNGNMYMCD